MSDRPPGYHSPEEVALLTAELRQELRETQLALMCLVAASGGRVEVPDEVVRHPPTEIRTWRREAAMTRVYETRRAL